MRLRAITEKIRKIDWSFHSGKHDKQLLWIGVGVLVLVALALRYSFLHATNTDYNIIASWYDFAKTHGWSTLQYGYSDGFSNYNPPFNYLLLLVSFLPLGKIVAIKGLMVLFDLLLAYSVYLVVKHFRPSGWVAPFAGLMTLFIPTVVATGAYWAQFDQFYTAFIFLSLYNVLEGKSRKSWIFFGIAIAIKLQAIFFLPVLVLMSMRRIKWWDAIWGVFAFAVVTFPPILFGRSLGSILSIYSDQTVLFHSLTLNAANIFQWIPEGDFKMFNVAGILWTIAVLVLTFILIVKYKRYTDKDVLLLTALMLLAVPFLLPQMHERYFFAGSIAVFFLLLFGLRYAWISLLVQGTVLLTYVPFLFGAQPFVAFPFLALGNLLAIGFVASGYMAPNLPVKRGKAFVKLPD